MLWDAIFGTFFVAAEMEDFFSQVVLLLMNVDSNESHLNITFCCMSCCMLHVACCMLHVSLCRMSLPHFEEIVGRQPIQQSSPWFKASTATMVLKHHRGRVIWYIYSFPVCSCSWNWSSFTDYHLTSRVKTGWTIKCIKCGGWKRKKKSFILFLFLFFHFF